MYSNTGDWSWLSYALGTVMLLFVAYNLNQFAKRSTGAGSMYAYISRGLGLMSGAVGGWSLIWAYLGISMAGVTGFTIFAAKLLAMMGISASPYSSFRGLRRCRLVLRLEECAALSDHDADLRRRVHGADRGAVLHCARPASSGDRYGAIRCRQIALVQCRAGRGGGDLSRWSGFECATAFGDEAKNPLKSIPKAVNMSLIISGAFFVFVTYVMVMGTRGYSTTLDKLDAPLNTLAQLAHVPILQVPLSLGAMISFFALCL